MKAEIMWAWRRLNANYWFYPALFAVLALVLAFGCIYADRAGWAEWLNDAAWLAPARPQGASTMLQVIAGSMIAVASTVFSITIVAVSYASGTYGPRLLTNFMEDKGNQFSLATFTNERGLEAMGSNLFRETEASGPGVVTDPGTDGVGILRQGYLEDSSVDAVREVTELIEAQRAYELNAKVITAADQMMSTTSQVR